MADLGLCFRWDSTDSEGTQIQKGVWGGGTGVTGPGMRWVLRKMRRLEQGTPVTWIRDCGVRGLHLVPSPLSGVHSLRVAQGKKVGVAEVRWLSSGGCWRVRSVPPSLPTPVPRSTSSSCRASSTLSAASLRGESIWNGSRFRFHRESAV